MSNIPAQGQSNVGFPQAHGQQPYQHVQQFTQFAQQPAPVASNMTNGPSTHAMNPFPFPNASTSQPPNNHFINQSQPVQSQPQMGNGGPISATNASFQYNQPPQPTSAFPAPSGFAPQKPTSFANPSPSFSPAPPAVNGQYPRPPGPPQPGTNYQPPIAPQPTYPPGSGFSQQPPSFSPAPSLPPMNGSTGQTPIPSAANSLPSQPPIPQKTNIFANAMPASFPQPPAMNGPPGIPSGPQPPLGNGYPPQQQQMTPRNSIPSSPYGQVPPPSCNPQHHMPTNQMQQMNQQFGQMNVNAPGAPVAGAYRSDVIDLMAERNVQQYGFDDLEMTLPQQLANPEAHIDPGIFRSTLQAVPQSEELLKKSRLPFAITLHPFRDVKNLNIIQTSNIVRCRYCRTYINPYVQLPDHRHWKCNLCNRNNDLPDDFSWDPVTKAFGDPRNRPEIKNATVEFIAPSEYMLRPPQPVIYVFLLDVSANAIQSGYLRTFSEQLLINLDQMPGDDRAQIAFLAVDQCLHFYSFTSSKRGPCEMIVDDVEDAFVPAVTSLLVPIKKFRDVIKTFVRDLPNFFSVGPTSHGNCLGAALKMAHSMITEIGGRISVFQVSLPSLGPGALKNREEPGSSDGGQNLGPATDFYKALSLECTGNQVCLDLFMLNSQYSDIATLSEISKFSSGCVYHFPNFNLSQDFLQVKRFEKVLTRYLTRKIGLEAVLRIRTTRGLALTGFYGNHFVRSTDLLAMANVNPDSAISVQVMIEEKLAGHVCFQSALLYTSSKGDRRIRVHTMCLPTTGDLLQLYNHFDLKASVSYLAKIGVERSMAGNALADSREALVNAVVDSVGSFQKAVSRSGGMLVPRSGHLRLFPSMVLAMLKHPAFSSARGVKLDDRVAAMMMLRFSPLEQILSDFYPRLYRLNDVTSTSAENEESYPQPLPLSFEHIQRDGIYLLEAGSSVYVYVPSTADPSLIHSLFGCGYHDINENSFHELENEVSKNVFEFIKYVTLFRFYLGPIIIVKEHSAHREQFVRRLVEDRSESTHSYVEFLQHLKREINN